MISPYHDARVLPTPKRQAVQPGANPPDYVGPRTFIQAKQSVSKVRHNMFASMSFLFLRKRHGYITNVVRNSIHNTNYCNVDIIVFVVKA